MPKLTGGCHCGSVRYSIDGEMHFAAVCHCHSCRKSAGAPIVSWAMFDAGAVEVNREDAAVYASSEGVKRTFCPTCGTSLFFEAEYIAGLIDVTTESLDDPDAIVASAQIWTSNEGACARALTDMARFEELPPQG